MPETAHAPTEDGRANDHPDGVATRCEEDRDATAGPPRPAAGRLGGLWAVLERDFVVTTSKRSFLVLRLAVVLLAAIVAGAVIVANEGAPADSVGRSLIVAAVFVLPAVAFLIAPAAGAAAISSEREGGTLDLVRVAPGNGWTFVVAKLLSRLGGLLVLVLGVLPVAGIAFVYGGVGATEFFRIVLLTFVFAAAGTAAGILTSAYSRSTAGAVLTAYVLLVVGPGLPGWLYAIAANEWDLPRHWNELVATTQPLAVWFFEANGHLSFRGRFMDVLFGHSAVTALVSGLAVVVAARRMQREGAVPAGGRRKRTRRRRGVFLERPVLDRGVRGSPLHRPRKIAWVMPAIALAAVAIHLIAWADDSFGTYDEEYLALLLIVGPILALQTLTTSSALLAVERKKGALDLLLAAPVTSRELVRGFATASVLGTLPSLAIVFVYGAIGCVMQQVAPITLLVWCAVTIVLLRFVAAIGLRVSITARSPGVAVLRAFATLGALLVGHGLLLFVIALAERDAKDALEFLIPWSPPLFPWLTTWSVDRGLGLDALGTGPEVGTFVSAWVALAAHALATRRLLRGAVTALDRSLSRD